MEVKLEDSLKQERQFCYTCLSTDRRLTSIENYVEIFYKFSNSSFVLSSDSMICWECEAMLKKCRKFQMRVDKAQKILSYYFYKQDKLLNSLSNLKITNICPESAIEVNHEEVKIEVPCVIKKEIDVHCDSSNNYELGYESNDPNDDYETNDFYGNNKTNDDLGITETNDDHGNKEINIGEGKNYIKNNDLAKVSPQIVVKCEKIDAVKTKNQVQIENRNRRRTKKVYKLVTKLSQNFVEKFTREVRIKNKEIYNLVAKQRIIDSYVETKFKCHSCLLGWKSEKLLEDHNNMCHVLSIGEHICDICQCRFNTKEQLSAHIHSHLVVRRCPFCAHVCNTEQMSQHIVTHNKLVQCGECKIILLNTKEYYAHYKELHDYCICDVCGKRTRSKRVLETHIMNYHTKLECNECNRTYSSKDSLKRHKARHRGKNEAAYCVQCDRQYSCEFQFKRHLASSAAHAAERGSSAPRYPCAECGRVYTKRQYMVNHHRLVHLKRTKYYCQHCDRYFLNGFRFMEHNKYQHLGQEKNKNKICTVCGRGFHTNRILENHMRTHSGERPFECNHCGAKFTQKYAMLTHVRHVHLRLSRRKWKTETSIG